MGLSTLYNVNILCVGGDGGLNVSRVVGKYIVSSHSM